MYPNGARVNPNKRTVPYYTNNIVKSRKELHEEYKFYLKMRKVLNNKPKLKKEVQKKLNLIERIFNGLIEYSKPPICKDKNVKE